MHAAENQRFVCPVSAQCGGCQLSRLNYAEQLHLKQRRVEELLTPLGRVAPIIGMNDPFHYRNKVHAVLGVDKRGNTIRGVYQAGTHRVVSVSHCLIEDKRADRIITTVHGLMKSFKLRPYNEYTQRGFLRHILVRTAHITGQIMLILVTTQAEFPSKTNFVQAVRHQHPEISTIVQNINDLRTSMVLGRNDIVLYGPGYIEDELCGKRFRISAQSFYQINSVQTEKLYRKAIEYAALRKNETALDAYCGIGTIALTASNSCARMLGVELNPQAVKDAKQNAALNHVQHVTFTCGDAGEWMSMMAHSGEKLDVAFMDPPRSGGDERFLRSLLALHPERVVYISCNPDTLRRDLEVLVAGGYQMVEATPVDMFPCTEHVESVCLLRFVGAPTRTPKARAATIASKPIA